MTMSNVSKCTDWRIETYIGSIVISGADPEKEQEKALELMRESYREATSHSEKVGNVRKVCRPIVKICYSGKCVEGEPYYEVKSILLYSRLVREGKAPPATLTFYVMCRECTET